MVEVPKTSLWQLEINIEVWIGRCNNYKFWINPYEQHLEEPINIFRHQVFDHFNQSHQVRLELNLKWMLQNIAFKELNSQLFLPLFSPQVVSWCGTDVWFPFLDVKLTDVNSLKEFSRVHPVDLSPKKLSLTAA